MDSASTKIFVSLGVASMAAISAPAINGFRNVPAGICALVGAVLPWILVSGIIHGMTSVLALVGLASVASSFLFALFFYSVEEVGTKRTIALGLITTAICAGIYPGVLLAYGLLLSDL